jgi:uncharacterized protein (DUF736 family)
MAYEQKDNSGSFFKNDKKEKENQPDYKGKCVVDGVEKQMGAWLRESKNGVKYMSVKFSEPYNKDGANSAQTTNDDAPF